MNALSNGVDIEYNIAQYCSFFLAVRSPAVCLVNLPSLYTSMMSVQGSVSGFEPSCFQSPFYEPSQHRRAVSMPYKQPRKMSPPSPPSTLSSRRPSPQHLAPPPYVAQERSFSPLSKMHLVEEVRSAPSPEFDENLMVQLNDLTQKDQVCESIRQTLFTHFHMRLRMHVYGCKTFPL